MKRTPSLELARIKSLGRCECSADERTVLLFFSIERQHRPIGLHSQNRNEAHLSIFCTNQLLIHLKPDGQGIFMCYHAWVTERGGRRQETTYLCAIYVQDRAVGDPALRVDIISFYLPRSLHFLLRTSTRLALRCASSPLPSSLVPRRLEYNILSQTPCPKKSIVWRKLPFGQGDEAVGEPPCWIRDADHDSKA